MLIDVLINPIRHRYRLIGTRIVEKWGYDMIGKFVHELPDPERLAIVLENYRIVVETKRPLFIRMLSSERHRPKS